MNFILKLRKHLLRFAKIHQIFLLLLQHFFYLLHLSIIFLLADGKISA